MPQLERDAGSKVGIAQPEEAKNDEGSMMQLGDEQVNEEVKSIDEGNNIDVVAGNEAGGGCAAIEELKFDGILDLFLEKCQLQAHRSAQGAS
ncbi:hypothetical protein C0995_008884 [Termitomyces sp. Mi166|nr:hypothetical protein C0995_008884 [Termitomyces sp. Mi166\